MTAPTVHPFCRPEIPAFGCAGHDESIASFEAGGPRMERLAYIPQPARDKTLLHRAITQTVPASLTAFGFRSVHRPTPREVAPPLYVNTRDKSRFTGLGTNGGRSRVGRVHQLLLILTVPHPFVSRSLPALPQTLRPDVPRFQSERRDTRLQSSVVWVGYLLKAT